jgi:hypothetical protein
LTVPKESLFSDSISKFKISNDAYKSEYELATKYMCLNLRTTEKSQLTPL